MLEIKRDIKNNVSSAKSVSNYGHDDKLTGNRVWKISSTEKTQINFPR